MVVLTDVLIRYSSLTLQQIPKGADAGRRHEQMSDAEGPPDSSNQFGLAARPFFHFL